MTPHPQVRPTIFALTTLLVLPLTTPLGTAQQPISTPLARQTPEDAQSSDLSRQSQAHDQALVDEINALRQRLGGGITAQLSDLFDNPAGNTHPERTIDQTPMTEQQSQADFLEELQRLVNQTNRQSPVESNEPEDTLSLPRTKNAYQSNTAASQDSGNSVLSRPNELSFELIQREIHLRTAARMLEKAAAQLEETDQTSTADQLRDIAQRLWREARPKPRRRR